MKKIVSCLLAMLGIGTACTTAHDVEVNEFADLIKQDDVELLDVRTPDEYAQGHLAGALNVDVNLDNFADSALALLLAIGMTLCLLSACGQGGPAPSQTSAADASTAELSAQPAEAATEPEQETTSLPENSAEAEGSGEIPQEPPEDAAASPLTGSTVKGIDYPIGDPDDPTAPVNPVVPKETDDQ